MKLISEGSIKCRVSCEEDKNGKKEYKIKVKVFYSLTSRIVMGVYTPKKS